MMARQQQSLLLLKPKVRAATPAKKSSVKKTQVKMTPVKKAKAKKTQVKKTLQVVPAQVPQEDATLVVGVSAVAHQVDAVAAQADEPAPVVNAADVNAADVVDVAIPAVPAVEYEDVHTPEANGSPPQRPPQTELFLKSKGIVVLIGI
jgi:hypothetical protein